MQVFQRVVHFVAGIALGNSSRPECSYHGPASERSAVTAPLRVKSEHCQ